MSKRAVPEMAFDVSSSDDDAPEEVSATSSRQQGISELKDLKESLRKGKEEERERRRQRNEMFRIQKEKKLKDLSKRKLPDDVLEAISAKSAKETKKKVPSKKAISRSDGDDEGGDSEEDEKNSEAGDDDLSDSGVEGSVKGYSGVEDFIPLGSGSGLALVTPGAIAKVAQTAAQKALSFKQKRLYDRHIPRENAQQRRAKVMKRRVANQMK